MPKKRTRWDNMCIYISYLIIEHGFNELGMTAEEIVFQTSINRSQLLTILSSNFTKDKFPDLIKDDKVSIEKCFARELKRLEEEKNEVSYLIRLEKRILSYFRQREGKK